MAETFKKYKKVIITSIIVYLVWVVFNIISIAWLEWWKLTLGLLFTLTPLVAIGIVIGLIVIYKKAKVSDKRTEIKNKKQKQLDSDTVIPWAKEHILNKKGDVFDYEDNELRKFGKEENRTPIVYINGHGYPSGKFYNLFVNLFEPKEHTLKEGRLTKREISKVIKDLADAYLGKTKQIIRSTTAEGTRRVVETEEDEHLLEKFEKLKK